MIAAGMPGGYAADDGSALHFENGKLKDVVSSRKKAKAYRVDVVEGQVREEPPESGFLG